MRAPWRGRRDAEELQRLLEGPLARSSGATAAPVADPELARLVALTGELRALPQPEARPDFVADLRERLMAQAATTLATDPGPDPAPRPAAPDPDARARLRAPYGRNRRERRVAILAGTAAVLAATTSVAVASQSAVPGDVLYPVKRAIENTHSGVTLDEGRKGTTLLAQARSRLEELQELTRRTDDGASSEDAAAIEETLTSFSEQATEASDLLLADFDDRGEQESVDRVQEFVVDSFARLDEIAPLVPPDAREALVEAGRVLTGIQQTLQSACPACPVSPTEIPQWLVSQAGPVLDGLLPPATGTPAPTPAPSPTPSVEPVRPPKPAPAPSPPAPQPSVPPPSALPPPPAPAPAQPERPGGAPSRKPKGPAGKLLEDLTTPPSGAPTLPVVPEVLQGVGDLLDDLTGPLLPPTPRP
ncbi:DUF5667 domain-containing protein [Nocardioides pantholopis]|uniref:DUF5667 domain-containing protein n=1 Tax=Nocardioides pantholopis TaxID=2483798 RepID=UPI000FD735AD|nr:DUF5667 domain-containing protein [Nocardioides pantholopis]